VIISGISCQIFVCGFTVTPTGLYLFFHQLPLSMEHHTGVGISDPPQNGACPSSANVGSSYSQKEPQ